MTKERPLILITNDDGYLAKGINELVNSLRDLGDLVVFAPDGPRSGMSSAKPDLLVSGINHGGNMAICVNYSGTMGAAIEGCIFDVPSLGVSLLDHRADADFTESCRLGRQVAQKVLEEGLPHGTYLNLNVPVADRVKGVKVCRQTDGRWVREFKLSEDGAGKPVYWLTGDFESREPILPDNDMVALDAGYASLVPCKVDVTDYEFMSHLDNWKL